MLLHKNQELMKAELWKALFCNCKPVGITGNISEWYCHSRTGSTYFRRVYSQTVQVPKVQVHVKKRGNKFFSDRICSSHFLPPTLSYQHMQRGYFNSHPQLSGRACKTQLHREDCPPRHHRFHRQRPMSSQWIVNVKGWCTRPTSHIR